jgi:hypothetical protein
MADKETLWHMKNKELSGEMYDLTASSTISATGKVKFEEAKKNGISETFYKYIDELKYMTDDKTDDKFNKRQERLNFLQGCQAIDKMIMDENYPDDNNELKQPNLEKLFSFTCNYLNGNNGINQHTNQPIIVILSGGNVTTIYINLLKNLLTNTDNMEIFVSRFFHGIDFESNIKIIKILNKIRELFNEETNKKLSKKIITPIMQIKFQLNKTELKLSDLDFIIVPNKDNIINAFFPLPESRGGNFIDIKEKNKRKIYDVDSEELLEKRVRKRPQLYTPPKNTPAPRNNTRKKTSAPPKKTPVNVMRKNNGTNAKYESNPGSSTQKTTVETEGVLLVRLKTANKYLDLVNSSKNMPSEIRNIVLDVNNYFKATEYSCWNDLKKLETTIQLLRLPQLFRHDYLLKQDVTELCKNYLLKMKAQKILISKMTDLNLEHLINYLSYPDRNDDAYLTPDAEKYIEPNTTIKLANFMNFIHINGKRQNKLIADLCEKKSSLDKKYSTAQSVVDNFKSLESITDMNRPLVKIMSELVLEFSNNNAIINTLERIHKTFRGSQNTAGKFTNITPAVSNLASLHKRLTNSIASLIDPEMSEMKDMIIPYNSKISTNIFTPLKITSASGDKVNSILIDAVNTHTAYADMLEPDPKMDSLINSLETIKISGGRKKTQKRTRTRTRTRRKKYKKYTSKKH